jgi:LysM repeat protein
VSEAAVLTVLLAEAALFATALAIFGVLAAVLRTRAAQRNRQGSAERQIRDEAAAAERVNRRLAELAPSQKAPSPHAAPALGAPAAATQVAFVSGRRRGSRRPVTLAVAGILVVLLAVVVLTPRAVPGGVLGVRGVPAPMPSRMSDRASATGAGMATQGSTGSSSPSAAPSLEGASSTPTATTQTPTPKPNNGFPSPTPVPSAAIAPVGTTELTATSPCGAKPCVVYVVRSGDTVGRIARRFGVSIAAILAVNPQLRDPNLIVTGQTLLLPSATP